jgi:hypothetical protein
MPTLRSRSGLVVFGILAVSVTFAVAAPLAGGSSHKAKHPKAASACSYVRASTVSAIVGAPVGSKAVSLSYPPGASQCIYSTASGVLPIRTVSIVVLTSKELAKIHTNASTYLSQAAATLTNPTVIPKLGKKAYSFGNGATIDAVVGSSIVTVNGGFGSSSPMVAKLLAADVAKVVH